MNEMTSHYKSLRDMPRPKKEPHRGNWSLVWIFGNQSVPVMLDKPYAICKDALNHNKRLPQFRHGELKIVPFK